MKKMFLNTEKLNKDEKRRLLLNKKYEKENNTLAAPGGAAEGVMSRVGALTKKQLRALIAIIVAVCVVLPGLLVGMHIRAEQTRATSARKDNPYVYTDKQVSDNGDGTYHLKLEGYATAQSIIDPETVDTILVLERSDDMNKELYRRDKTNLYTYTVFDENTLKSNNDMFDDMNHLNEYLTIFGNEIKFSISNKYQNNKYVRDPNNETVYVYLCQTYQTTNDSTIWPPLIQFTNHYTYSIVDTQGNVYESQELTESLGETLLRMGLSTFVSQLDHIDLEWQKNIFHPEYTTYQDYVDGTGLTETKDVYRVDRVYTRDDDNATNATLWEKQQTNGPLWIKDNDGNWLKVKIEKQGTYSTKYGDYTPYYVYYAFDKNDDMSDNSMALYTAVYGNPYYGSEQSVFQGFKVYDEQGNVDYDNSLLHKSLYCSEDSEVTVTRLDALKESVEDFILDIYKNAVENEVPQDYQRVGIVSYASKSSVNSAKETKIEYHLQDIKDEATAYKMIKTVYNMEGNGRRRIDDGLNYAKQELDANSDPNHRVNIISFTAGNPSSSELNNDFEMMIADNALAERKRIENDYEKSTFYSIGLYDGADSDELYGDYFYRTLYQAIPCDGSEDSFWGGTIFSSWTNPDMSPADAAATNRFLNMLSSNYTGTLDTDTYYSALEKALYNAWILGSGIRGHNTGMQGSKPIYLGGLSLGSGYEVVDEITSDEWTNAGYYVPATNGAELNSAFDTIAEQIMVPTSDLEGSRMTDDVSDYFTNISNVTAYTVPGTINNWSTNEADREYVSSNNITQTNTSVTVEGFNYTDNYVTDSHPGRKMVLEFDVSPISDFLGGNKVPTNLSTSGIYDRNDTDVENFIVPTVDITPATALVTDDKYIYYSNVQDLRELFTVPADKVDGLRNDFVDLQYIVLKPGEDGEDPTEVFTYSIAAGDLDEDGMFDIGGEDKANQYPSLEENTTYIIRCVATPKYDGSITDPTTEEQTATVYVFTPKLTVTDTTKEYSDATQGTYYVNLPNDNLVGEVEWINDETDHTTVDDGVLPDLEFEFYSYNTVNTWEQPWTGPLTDATNHPQTETTDYRVNIIVKDSDEDYRTYTTYIENYILSNGDKVPVSQYDETVHGPRVQETYTAYDEDGNELPDTPMYEEDGVTPVWKTEFIETEITVDVPDSNDMDEGFATYVNVTDDTKTKNNTEGNFTVYVGTPFNFYISKVFDGELASPEDITFTISGSDNSEYVITFDDDTEFTGQTSTNPKTLPNDAQLKTGITYTIVETYTNGTERDYNTTATGTAGSEALTLTNSAGEGENATFELMIPSSQNPQEVRIVVTNTDETEYTPPTGYSEDADSSNILLIALAAAATVSAGGYGVYRVYRPKKENG